MRKNKYLEGRASSYSSLNRKTVHFSYEKGKKLNPKKYRNVEGIYLKKIYISLL